MNIGRSFPRLGFVLAIPTVALGCVVCWCDTAGADDPPEVKGVIATRVHFEGESREKLAAAALDLLAGCTLARSASEAEWVQADGGCRLSIAFATPRTVTLDATLARSTKRDKLEIAEMILTFPFSAGRVWIRSDNAYFWFAKWPGAQSARLCDPIQRLLKEATLD